MKSAVRKIDRALKRLYNLDRCYRAEDFLISRPLPAQKLAGNANFQGALFVRSLPGPELSKQLSLGIYLSESVLNQLASFKNWRGPAWSHDQIAAFTVAAEEISHFHYLLHHAHQGRQVSQFELELQGDVDKFLLTYFANGGRGIEGINSSLFEVLFEQLFYCFRLSDRLSDDEKGRYLDANHFARRLILKLRRLLSQPSGHELAFRMIRRFFRLNASEKVSLIASVD